jgi:hypothetical protein
MTTRSVSPTNLRYFRHWLGLISLHHNVNCPDQVLELAATWLTANYRRPIADWANARRSVAAEAFRQGWKVSALAVPASVNLQPHAL